MLIKKYTTDWANNFTELKGEIDNGLSGLSYQIEHIGSTSVPGLDSKDIIDIDISFDTDSDFEKIKSKLLAIGYFHNGNQGIEHREVFKRSGKVYNEILDTLKHHLYVCPTDSAELKNHLLFRDALRENESMREEYQIKKYELAEKANQDKKTYAYLKELHLREYINSILEIRKKSFDQRTRNTKSE